MSHRGFPEKDFWRMTNFENISQLPRQNKRAIRRSKPWFTQARWRLPGCADEIKGTNKKVDPSLDLLADEFKQCLDGKDATAGKRILLRLLLRYVAGDGQKASNEEPRAILLSGRTSDSGRNIRERYGCKTLDWHLFLCRPVVSKGGKDDQN